jgi:hypothetical protein
MIEIATNHGGGERMIFVHEVNDFKGEAMKAFDYVKTTLNPRRIPMTLKFGTKLEFPPLQAADVLAYEGGKFVKSPTGKPRRAWTALDPDKTRLIVRRYCGAQKLVMQQRGKYGATRQAQVPRRSLRMLAEGGALLRRMARPGPTNGAVASDCNR